MTARFVPFTATPFVTAQVADITDEQRFPEFAALEAHWQSLPAARRAELEAEWRS